jgi:ferric-dicitrate binding protein FerR (iron transport regulator)
VAASVVLLLGIGIYFLVRQDNTLSPSVENVAGKGMNPGKDGAVLTLADGTNMVLDSLVNGMIAEQNGSKVSLVNGKLAYVPTSDTATAVLFNTMTTPKGRQFQVMLPDGTRVWLNAASSIRYPTRFKGIERKVDLTGEAYFEVARNNAMPFKVNVNGKSEVEVLGTHFNINAYEDENTINTTLIGGAVKVKAPDQPAVILKPGQQAQLPVEPGIIKVIRNADTDQVMAWKNGFFNFEGQSLRVVMRQLERWYDIKVVYKENVQDIIFRGKIFRNLKLADVLYILQKMGVRFEMQGRILTVTT